MQNLSTMISGLQEAEVKLKFHKLDLEQQFSQDQNCFQGFFKDNKSSPSSYQKGNQVNNN